MCVKIFGNLLSVISMQAVTTKAPGKSCRRIMITKARRYLQVGNVKRGLPIREIFHQIDNC